METKKGTPPIVTEKVEIQVVSTRFDVHVGKNFSVRFFTDDSSEEQAALLLRVLQHLGHEVTLQTTRRR